MRADAPTRDRVRPIHLRPSTVPLGLYIRPGWSDHIVLERLLREGRVAGASGLVLHAEAEWRRRHSEMTQEAGRRGLETVLDPMAIELVTPAGAARAGLASLPWAQAVTEELVRGEAIHAVQIATDVVQTVVEGGFSAVLAPTQHVDQGAALEWSLGAARTIALRNELDRRGLANVPVYYPLSIPARALSNRADRVAIARHLQGLPIDAVWLRVTPFGARSGALPLGRYIQACRDLHALGLPLVGERTGTAGLALLAFGAVGGIEGGLTVGEQYDFARLKRPPRDAKGFSMAARVYLASIGSFVDARRADAFFAAKGTKPAFGCRETACCPRGLRDMLGEPARHFVQTRVREVKAMSDVPARQRASWYLDEFLRPASDVVIRAERADARFAKDRTRLDAWRLMLGGMLKEAPPQSYALAPEGRRIERRQLA